MCNFKGFFAGYARTPYFMMIEKLLEISIAAAIAAGNAIHDIYTDPLADFSVEHKADNSPLTIADKRSHEVIMSYLEKTQIPILSEEGKEIPYAVRKEWSTLWIVDPLDGTKEFIKRNGEFTVNIALVENGVPTLGVIYVPVTRMLYYGAKGVGSYKVEVSAATSMEQLYQNAIKLPVAKQHEGFVVVASRSHMNAETEQLINELKQQHGEVDLRSSGSSLKICLVAEGSADIYPRFAPTMEWDTAAGHAIALYAGRQMVKTSSEEPLTYNKEQLLNPWFIVR